MIVVVEGIDRVGKTTFCKKLHGKTGIPVFREPIDFSLFSCNDGEYIRSIMVEKMLSILRLVKATESDIIFDRFHLSEWVYGSIERNAKIKSGIEGIDFLLKELGAKIVLIHPVDIEQVSKEHGKDLTEHERMFRSFNSKCDIINCTYLETESLTIKFDCEHREEMIQKWECDHFDESEDMSS